MELQQKETQEQLERKMKAEEIAKQINEFENDYSKMAEYFEAVRHIDYRTTRNKVYRAAVIFFSSGCKSIYVDTGCMCVTVKCGIERAEASISQKAARLIDEIFKGIYKSCYCY